MLAPRPLPPCTPQRAACRRRHAPLQKRLAAALTTAPEPPTAAPAASEPAANPAAAAAAAAVAARPSGPRLRAALAPWQADALRAFWLRAGVGSGKPRQVERLVALAPQQLLFRSPAELGRRLAALRSALWTALGVQPGTATAPPQPQPQPPAPGGSGAAADLAAQMVGRFPAVLRGDPAGWAPRLGALQDGLGASGPEVAHLLRHSPQLLCLSPKLSVARRARALQRLLGGGADAGVSGGAAAALCPTLLTVTEAAASRGLDALATLLRQHDCAPPAAAGPPAAAAAAPADDQAAAAAAAAAARRRRGAAAPAAAAAAALASSLASARLLARASPRLLCASPATVAARLGLLQRLRPGEAASLLATGSPASLARLLVASEAALRRVQYVDQECGGGGGAARLPIGAVRLVAMPTPRFDARFPGFRDWLRALAEGRAAPTPLPPPPQQQQQLRGRAGAAAAPAEGVARAEC